MGTRSKEDHLMTPQKIAMVNASNAVGNAEFPPVLVAIQNQIDRDFLPEWGNLAIPARLKFYSWAQFSNVPPEAWPIFINRHSIDPGALAWHTDDNRQIYGRVFAGDCRLYNLLLSVTLSHEILEMMVNPDASKAYKMADGRMIAYEVCDPVQADELSYEKDGSGVKVSNFVLPSYFSN